MIRESQQKLYKSIPIISRGLGLVWQAAPVWTIAWSILLLLQGLVPAAQIYLTQQTVDLLATTLVRQDVATHLVRAWLPITLIGLLWIISQLLTSLIGWVRSAQAELVRDSIHTLIQDRALSLDIAFYENTASYDLLHRARGEALSQPISLLESIGTLIQNSLTLVILAGMLIKYTPWLPLLLIGSALPGLWTIRRYVLRQHQWLLDNTINERLTHYYDWLLTDRSSAPEMRLFDLGDYHQGLFQALRQQLRHSRLTLAWDEMIAELTASTLSWLGGLIGMVWMLMRAMKGMVSLGDIVLCYQAFQQGQQLLRSLMGSTGRIYRSTLFLENLFQFLSMQPQLGTPQNPQPFPSPLKKGIRFDGVTFRYPGSERAALDNFSIILQADRVTAIVGHNGAGKSTLIKLLCRFYDPQQGTIRLDDVNLRALDIIELRQQITVLFQEPVRYHTTAGENIAMGDRASNPSIERIQIAAGAAGAATPIERLPKSYETILGKWFGGDELSVGEWQRVALARAFLRNAPIIALDEPTSAMDSWAESDWLTRFRELSKGRTALMITHRFTTAMHADMIYVMTDGRIIESGTHKQLLAADGHYAESWWAQMKEVGKN